MSDWKPYLHDRLVREHLTGFVTIVPADAPEPVPLSCPVCEFMMRTREDESSYREFECCYACALSWAHPRRKEWRDGWRPTQEQLMSAVKSRPPLSVSFAVD